MEVMTKTDQTITVGIGEICVTEDPSTFLACFGLGSCIGLCAYDPTSRVAGMAHIVLPESNHGSPSGDQTKYADVAVPVLLEKMRKQGAIKSRLIVKLVGGAQMIQAPGFEDVLDMGARNLEMTNKTLNKEGIRPKATDAGGGQGRSVWLSAGSGEVMVRTAGKEYKML
jgi:chemotaxis protein CheD